MKILVTGATGFIGRYVVQHLVDLKKYEIIATSRNEETAKKFNWYKDVKYISCNLNDERKNFFTFFEEPDILIHLAWEGLPNFSELFHFEKNLFNDYKFIKNMIINGLKDLNITGTCFEYGKKSGILSEKIQTNPSMAYPLAKDTLRKFIQELNKKYNFNFKWIRIFYLYGEGQTPKSIIPQLDKALNNDEDVFNMSGGEQLRDYLPVEKVAEYIIRISIQNEINGIINCCSGEPISIRRIVEEHMNRRNMKIRLNLGFYPYPDYVAMAFWGDNTKLKKILRK